MGGFRFLHSHEYGQASGRAGRRGKDDKGVIIHLNNLYDINDNNLMRLLTEKYSVEHQIHLSLVLTLTSNSYHIWLVETQTFKSSSIRVCCIMKSMVKLENY